MTHNRKIIDDLHDIIHLALKIRQASEMLNDKIDEIFKRETKAVRNDEKKTYRPDISGNSDN